MQQKQEPQAAWLVALYASLIVVAATTILVPAARSPFLKVALGVLSFLALAVSFIDARRAGHLGMTPRQISAIPPSRRKRMSLVEAAALGISIVALWVDILS